VDLFVCVGGCVWFGFDVVDGGLDVMAWDFLDVGRVHSVAKGVW